MGLKKIFYPEFSAKGTLQPGLFNDVPINDKFNPSIFNPADQNSSILNRVVWNNETKLPEFDLYKDFPEDAKICFKELYDEVVCDFDSDNSKTNRVYFKDRLKVKNLIYLSKEHGESDEWIYFVILSIFINLKTRANLLNKHSNREKFNKVRTMIIEWADNLNTKSLNTKLTIHALFAFGALSGWHFCLKDVKILVKFYNSKLDNILKYIKLLKYKIIVNRETLKEVMTETDKDKTVLATISRNMMKILFGQDDSSSKKKK